VRNPLCFSKEGDPSGFALGMTLKGEFFAPIEIALNKRNGGDPSLSLGVTVNKLGS